ncbi:MAG: xanthine dehydrogenase family protein subunit M [Thermodesulfobacteriota bacterium]|nr:xanthine dehydrogenase family protein subunit M [Thermodesulfobacteriota bacterium]
MKPFEYYKVVTVAQAISLLTKHKEKAALLAGGSDFLGMMKDRLEGPKLKMPQFLIDLKGIKDLSYIKEQKSGLKIGASTTISEIASSDLIAKKFPLLAQAANQIAVPQIRNVGTLGGNLCQRPRCWYFRRGLFKDCMRKGGNNCYAPGGENQYHAILGSDICFIVNPSDMAPALAALNAKVEIATAKGNRMVPIEQFYIRPEKNILRENILTSQEMVVAVEIPHSAPNSKGVYLKLKERQAFDFAIVSVAVNLAFKGDLVFDSRIVFGGIAPFPFRATKSEATLKGKGVKEAMAAVCRAATDGAKPMSHNGYKVDATRGILEEALSLLA